MLFEDFERCIISNFVHLKGFIHFTDFWKLFYVGLKYVE